MNHEEYYTKKEAAHTLGISMATVDKIIRSGELIVLRVGMGKLPGVRLLKTSVHEFNYKEYKKRVRKKRVSKNNISS
jgi:excisionase family DNA binding protein